jgi:hypothetical protein
MATEFTKTQRFGRTPDEARRMLTDPQYMRRRAEATGALDFTVDQTVEPDGTEVFRTVRTFPARVPSYAQRLVGSTIQVTEEQRWAPAAPHAVVTVSFSGMLGFAGTLVLRAAEGGTEAVTTGAFRAQVPLIGGRLEALVAEQTERYLAEEEAVASSWLGGS